MCWKVPDRFSGKESGQLAFTLLGASLGWLKSSQISPLFYMVSHPARHRSGTEISLKEISSRRVASQSLPTNTDPLPGDVRKQLFPAPWKDGWRCWEEQRFRISLSLGWGTCDGSGDQGIICGHHRTAGSLLEGANPAGIGEGSKDSEWTRSFSLIAVNAWELSLCPDASQGGEKDNRKWKTPWKTIYCKLYISPKPLLHWKKMSYF